MTTTDAPITKAIAKKAKSVAQKSDVPANPAAKPPAKAAVTPAAKEPAASATPTADARAEVSAKAVLPVAQKSAVAAKQAAQSPARLPAKAPPLAVAKKPAVAAKSAATSGSTMPAKLVSKAALKPSAANPVLQVTPKASSTQADDQKADKVLREKKPKLVRDSFTIPKAEYAVLDELKLRAGKLGSLIKKSELIRAGIKALASMPDAVYVEALRAVPTIKTGRPATD